MGNGNCIFRGIGFVPPTGLKFLLIFFNIFSANSLIFAQEKPNEVFPKQFLFTPPQPSIVIKLSVPNSKPIPQLRISMAGDSLLLSWSPVTVDTAGNEEAISYYEVFRDTIPYFTPSLFTRIAITTDTLFVDVESGLVGDPTVNHFYAISARDTNGNVSLPSAQVCEYDITLPPGWSMFSRPLFLRRQNCHCCLKIN